MSNSGFKIPLWFVPGVKFIDADGDKCIYLGQGGFRKFENAEILMKTDNRLSQIPTTGLYRLSFKPMSSHLMTCLYKGEWHIFEVFSEDRAQSWFDNMKEGWEKYQERPKIVVCGTCGKTSSWCNCYQNGNL